MRLLPTVLETSLSEVTGQATLTRVTRLLRGSQVSASGEIVVCRRWVGTSRLRQSPCGRPARAGPEGPASRPGVISAGLRWAWRLGQGLVGVRVAPGSMCGAGVRPRGQEGEPGGAGRGVSLLGFRVRGQERTDAGVPEGPRGKSVWRGKKVNLAASELISHRGSFLWLSVRRGFCPLEGRLAMSGDRLGVTPGTCPC